MAPRIYGLMAEFDDPNALVLAATSAREAGYRRMDAYSPFPIEELHHALGAHASRLPLIAFVAGRFTDQIQGQRFGHAGAIVEGSQGSPASKIAALRGAGVRVADKLSQIPRLVREALAKN